MLINIISEFDIEKLKNEIDKFRKENNIDPYLFVNEQTFIKLNDTSFKEYEDEVIRNFLKSKTYGKYYGCKIYIDDCLEFGDVELK